MKAKPPTIPVVASSMAESKDKVAPKTAKTSTNKERDVAQGTQHNEPDSVESISGLF